MGFQCSSLELQKGDTLDDLISLPAHAFASRSDHTQHPSFLTKSDERGMYPILVQIYFAFPLLPFPFFLALSITVDSNPVRVIVLILACNMILVTL